MIRKMITLAMFDALFFICFSIYFVSITECRTVPAKDDICARYPQFSLCLANSPNVPHEPPPQPPTAPPPVERQTLDRATYCKKYQLHYTYFCSPGVETDASAKDFCGAYGRNCDIKDTPQAYTKDQISAECNKKRQLAETYCTGNEPDSIKSQCDLYRQYCSGAVQQTPPVQTFDPLAYCTAYQQQFISGCQLARPPAGPIGNVINQGLAGGRKRRRRRQSDPAAIAAANGFSPDKVNALCTQYQGLASQFCNGNEPPGQIKEKCGLYRTFCTNQPQAASPGAAAPQAPPQTPQVPPQTPQSPALPGGSSSSDFCQNYVRTCSSLQQLTPQQSQLQQLCSNYAYFANTYCPGYETAQSRITCNNYRQYCMNQPPFRDIDGATNFNNGIANIPNNWGNGLLGFQG